VNILTRCLKRRLDRTEPPLRDLDALDAHTPTRTPVREYVPAFPELREPLGSGDVPTAIGDTCFRCHKNKVMPPAVWCDDCRPIVWGIGAEPIERQVSQ
jgi:hypothetical protein